MSSGIAARIAARFETTRSRKPSNLASTAPALGRIRGDALFNLMLGWRPDEHSESCECDPCQIVNQIADVARTQEVKRQALQDADQIIRDGDDLDRPKGEM